LDAYLDHHQSPSGNNAAVNVTQTDETTQLIASQFHAHPGPLVGTVSPPTPPPLTLDPELGGMEESEDARLMDSSEMDDIMSRLDHMDEGELRSSVRSLAAHAVALDEARTRERKKGNEKVSQPYTPPSITSSVFLAC
jgi:hypothetical protein